MELCNNPNLTMDVIDAMLLHNSGPQVRSILLELKANKLKVE